MHALLLWLALGQAGPAAPAATAPVEPPPPAPAAAATPAIPSPPARASGGRPPRAVEVVRLPGGGFRATLDGQPVAGADFYRAVMRPDLAATLDASLNRRTALWIVAGVAPLVGAGMGWVAGDAQHRTVPCDEPSPPPSVQVLAECARLRRQNRATVNRAVAIGAAGGVVTGALLWLAGRAVHPPEPTAAEAEALERAYRAGVAPWPAKAPVSDPPPGASLRLEAGPRAAWLALHVPF